MRSLRARKWVTSAVIVLWMCVVIYFLLGVLLASARDDTTKVMRRYETSDPSFSLRHNPKLSQRTVDLFRDLGFIPQPRLYPQDYHGDRANLPVFVSAVSAQDLPLVPDFVYSVLKYYPDKRLVIYSLDLTEQQRQKISTECRCLVRVVQWETYPEHIKNFKLEAFRPLLLQETLQEFGIVFWAEPATRFRTAELFSIERQAEKTGLVAWPLTHPTSTLTHYNMFRYFNTTHRDYHFHRMVEPHRLLLYNTPVVHQKLMLPWVQCALDLDCIAPVGSQPHGCDYSHRPRYIYAGCHKYDMSAFNVVLGQVFRGETPYIAVMDLFTVASPAPAPKRNWMGTWNLTAAFKLGS